MIKRDYYPMEQAAEIIGISTKELVYLAAHNEIPVYVLSAKHDLYFRRYINGKFAYSDFSSDRLAKLNIVTLEELEAGGNDAIVILDRKPASIFETQSDNFLEQSEQNHWDYFEFCPKGWLYIAPEKLSELYLSGKNIEHLWPPVIRLNNCELVILSQDLDNYQESKALIKTNDVITVKKNDAWIEYTRQIALEILEKNKSQSIERISEKTHKEMTKRHNEGKPNMTGRGDRIPSSETIRRHVFAKPHIGVNASHRTQNDRRNDLFEQFNQANPDYFKSGDKNKKQLKADLIAFSGCSSLFQSGFDNWWKSVDKNIYSLKAGRPTK